MMSFLTIDIVDLYNGLGFNSGFEPMTFEAFLSMCAFLAVLLLINRILGKNKIKESVFKNENLSNYSLSFEEELEFSDLAVKEKKVSLYIKALTVVLIIILIIVPFYGLINPDDLLMNIYFFNKAL